LEKGNAGKGGNRTSGTAAASAARVTTRRPDSAATAATLDAADTPVLSGSDAYANEVDDAAELM
jgi:hypothetical protein